MPDGSVRIEERRGKGGGEREEKEEREERDRGGKGTRGISCNAFVAAVIHSCPGSTISAVFLEVREKWTKGKEEWKKKRRKGERRKGKGRK